jgi:hypothetical protein
MHSYCRLLTATIIAWLVMITAVTSASARRIEVSNQGFFVRWTPLLIEFTGSIISCPVTIEGSFHSRTLSKVSGQLIGYITRAFVQGEEPPCTNSTATVLTARLPWHIQYVSFTGTLPRITRLRISLVGVEIRFQLGIACLVRTTQSNPAVGDISVAADGTARLLTILPEFSIPFIDCIGSARFNGTGEVFTQITPQVRITVRLVQ